MFWRIPSFWKPSRSFSLRPPRGRCGEQFVPWQIQFPFKCRFFGKRRGRLSSLENEPNPPPFFRGGDFRRGRGPFFSLAGQKNPLSVVVGSELSLQCSDSPSPRSRENNAVLKRSGIFQMSCSCFVSSVTIF